MSLTPVPGTTMMPNACMDQNPNCHAYDIPAVCTDYAGWAKDNCQMSCGLCRKWDLSTNIIAMIFAVIVSCISGLYMECFVLMQTLQCHGIPTFVDSMYY